MEAKYKRVKLACCMSGLSMSVVANLPPLLFLTFNSQYNISYSLLGFLVLVNYFTQMIVDLILSFFSHRFDIPKTVKFIPVLTTIGLLIFSIWPYLFPGNAFWGILIGTIVFSASGGLNEVLISPVIAAIPAKDPDREMSKLHSIYAWGVVGVVIISTVFIITFGAENWHWLAILFTAIPLIASALFLGAEIPEMETPEKVTGVIALLKNRVLWLMVFAIFLGGAAECTMSQWCSGYVEQALGIPKVWGDVFGVALFGLSLGLGRTLYGKFGKNIGKVLVLGVIGSTLCYLISAISPFPVLALFACVFTGFCSSMLWPGSLIASTELVPHGGVFIYAIMAAGGDFGAALGPQLIGLVTDFAIKNPTMLAIAEKLGLTGAQLGLKAGMVVGMLFPLVAIPVFIHILNMLKKSTR